MESLEKFKNYYSSLISKVDNVDDLALLIKFCYYFESDDVNLFREYKNNYKEGKNNTDLIIYLLCKRYKLNPVTEGKVIRNMYINNVYNNGLSFYLTQDVNVDEIFAKGINPKDGTDEIRDIKNTQELLTPVGLNNFFPNFNKKDLNKITCFRDYKMLYEIPPLWLRDLTKSIEDIDNLAKYETPLAKKELLRLDREYAYKYEDASRVIALVPNSYLGKSMEDIPYIYYENLDRDQMDERSTINKYELLFQTQKDVTTANYIPSYDLILIDAKTARIIESKEKKSTLTI